MYSAELIPAGLHAQLLVTLLPSTLPLIQDISCPLYLHLTLPASFIADRFQLAQLHTEGRLGSYDSTSKTIDFKGERDLEVPVDRANGSELLVRLSAGSKKGKERERPRDGEVVSWEIPLHLRYQVPVDRRRVDGKRNDTVRVELDWPVLFWACDELPEDAILPPTPACPPIFSDYPTLASFPVTIKSFHFLSPSPAPLLSCPNPLNKLPVTPLSMVVPTGVRSDLPWVESVNFVAIWFGMLWVCRAAWRGRRAGSQKVAKVD